MVLARLLQGFATGGEFASATSFLIESAPAHRRGFYGSWQMVGQGVAVFLGALVSAAVTRGLSPEALDRWGWRMPFLFGLLIGPVGVYIRRHLDETEGFIESNATPSQEAGTPMATHFSEVMVCLGLAAGQTIQAYVILLYMPTFATTQFGLPLGEALTAQSIGRCSSSGPGRCWQQSRGALPRGRGRRWTSRRDCGRGGGDSMAKQSATVSLAISLM
jgi:MFS family permease